MCCQFCPGHPSYSNVTQQYDWEIMVQGTSGQHAGKGKHLHHCWCYRAHISFFLTHTHTNTLFSIRYKTTAFRRSYIAGSHEIVWFIWSVGEDRMGALVVKFRFWYHINTDRKVCRCVLIYDDTSVDDLQILDDFMALVVCLS